MTDRERVEALLKRQQPDRIPIWPFVPMGFCSVYSKVSLADAYNKPEVSLAAQRNTAKDFGWVFLPVLGYAAIGGWEFGGDIKWPNSQFDQAPTVTRYPVETPDDTVDLHLPNVKTSGIIPLQMEFYKMSSQERLENEPFNVAFMGGGGFTFAGNIPGPEKFVKWLIKYPEAVHHLMRLVCDFQLELARLWRDTFGVEGALPCGAEPLTTNQLIPPRYFKQFALPYIKEVQEKVLAMGYKTTHMHICGDQNENLAYWAEVPFGDPGIVSIGHEVELETAAKYFPNNIILGNLDPAIIQVGTPEEVYEASRKVIEKGKKLPTGFIFSPGCELPPMANPNNVMAMTKAIKDFGWYE